MHLASQVDELRARDQTDDKIPGHPDSQYCVVESSALGSPHPRGQREAQDGVSCKGELTDDQRACEFSSPQERIKT
jgi:hypothetical protein